MKLNFLILLVIINPLFSMENSNVENQLKQLLENRQWNQKSLLYQFIKEESDNYSQTVKNDEFRELYYGGGLKLLSKGLFQEAIWSYHLSGAKLKYEKLQSALVEYLTNEQNDITLFNKKEGKDAVTGMTEVYEGVLAGNLQIFFKPATRDWRSDYKREYASYLLDKYWGLHMVPTTVIRKIGKEIGSVQIKVLLKTIKYAGKDYATKPDLMIIFDYLIKNTDRHADNYGVLQPGVECSPNGHLYYVAIDHSLSLNNSILPNHQGIIKAPDISKVKDILHSWPQALKLAFQKKLTLTPEMENQIIDLIGKKKMLKLKERIVLVQNL